MNLHRLFKNINNSVIHFYRNKIKQIVHINIINKINDIYNISLTFHLKILNLFLN